MANLGDELAKVEKGQAAARRGDRHRVFDWDKAARLIVERKPTVAEAGLGGDWSHTGGEIWRDGKPVPESDTYVYLSSNWATPQIEIDGETIDCWIYEDESPGWDAHTYWPPSALAIIGAAPSGEHP